MVRDLLIGVNDIEINEWLTIALPISIGLVIVSIVTIFVIIRGKN